MARWLSRLSELNIDVAHRTDITHQATDALSRLTTAGEDEAPIEDSLSVAVLKDILDNSPHIRLVKNMTFQSDDADKQAEAQAVKDIGAEKDGRGPKVFGRAKHWPGRRRVIR